VTPRSAAAGPADGQVSADAVQRYREGACGGHGSRRRRRGGGAAARCGGGAGGRRAARTHTSS
jgi:hypothetical protein